MSVFRPRDLSSSLAAKHYKPEKGLTVTELIVIILIIGILAAITIPAFLSPESPSTPSTPKISGVAVSGNTLVSSRGSGAGGNPAPVYTYRWRRCPSFCDVPSNWVSLTSSTNVATYDVQKADVGSAIDVVVTATNKEGSTSATSLATAIVK